MTLPLPVVTVTYSPGRHLDSFLRSLPDASGRELHVILADNGSTDGVPERAADGRENVELLRTGGNLGYGSAINVAARMLRARRDRGELDPEFLIVVNPDVTFGPGSIDELIACARRHPRAGSVGPRIRQPDGSTYPSARAVPTLRNGVGHALLSEVWPSNPWTAAYRADTDMDTEHTAGWLSGSCLLLRWSAFDAVGGFDERYFMYLEDVDLGDRLGRAGWENVYCPAALIGHDQGHSAGAHLDLMLPAHHDSAYRFQADRHPGPWMAPLRIVLWLGLKLRAAVALAASRPLPLRR
ncbi:glycosyltransferase family 2 protein [Corynebacterium sp. TAE3-ERU16]|uniref:glycosyltransferase family 2 protein n=1 Tax=Corynebacterium sp. TAE3-ERU16 TaxID=2849493 RepID=UPI001C460B28|nr:glycosyltransferase family 2 protein [Corynebacterium sp. TAE3-ERU16]